jgi:transglutaminase-like putative cysteine protease
MNTWPFAVARYALAAGTAALAGMSFAPVFGGTGTAFLLAVLAPPAAVLCWAMWARTTVRPDGDRARVPAPVAAAGLVAVLAAAGLTTMPGADVASGPYRLLTGALPADPSGPQLATVSALTGFTALVCCLLVLSERAAIATVLPAVACLLAGLGLGAATAALPGWYVPAFVGLAGLQLFVGRAAADRAGGGTGRVVIAAVMLAAAVAAPVALAGLLPGADADEPADLRAVVDSPVQPKADTNPLAQFPVLRNGELLLNLTGTASERVDRLRMVTLTDFDGRTWSTRADYRRAGHRLPAGDTATTTRGVTLDLTVGTPEAVNWLPGPGRASELSVSGLGVDEETGDVVVPAGSPTPATYRVTGTEPRIDRGQLVLDEPSPAAVRPKLRLPPDILEFVTKATGSAPTDADRFLALYQTLKKPPFGYDGSPEAVGGHGLYQISALLREKRGTSEQYASAFAVMCRHLGWDARVVLGFRPQWNGNRFEVTGRDVHAWVEVRFGGLGWVPVDPTPTEASPGRAPADGPPPPPRAADPLDAIPDPGDQPSAEPGPAAPRPTAPPPAQAGFPVWLVLTAGAVVAVVVAVPAAKAIRRARRRRTGSARDRGLAAWREALDAIRASGTPLPRSATTSEIVTGSGASCPPALRSLARRTDVTAFAPEEPTDHDARAAWADSDAVRATIRRGRSFPARVAAALDPRPLWTSR